MQWFGVYVGRVIDIRDPENRGRVQVSMPLERLEGWARIATLFAGHASGGWFVPEVDDEVVVAFEAGNPRRPIVLGLLWKDGAQPSITLRKGPDSLHISDSNGNSVTFDSAGITVTASAKVTIQASQVAISAGALSVDAGMSKFSGLVQADALVTNSVVSSSYTPGVGNIW